MPGVEELDDFAKARIGSNLLDRRMLEMLSPSMCGSAVVFNAVLLGPHGWLSSGLVEAGAAPRRSRCRLRYDYYSDGWGSNDVDAANRSSQRAVSFMI